MIEGRSLLEEDRFLRVDLNRRPPVYLFMKHPE